MVQNYKDILTCNSQIDVRYPRRRLLIIDPTMKDLLIGNFRGRYTHSSPIIVEYSQEETILQRRIGPMLRMTAAQVVFVNRGFLDAAIPQHDDHFVRGDTGGENTREYGGTTVRGFDEFRGRFGLRAHDNEHRNEN